MAQLGLNCVYDFKKQRKGIKVTVKTFGKKTFGGIMRNKQLRALSKNIKYKHSDNKIPEGGISGNNYMISITLQN